MAQKLSVGHTVFLSHSGVDKDFVRILAEELRKRCFTPFFDEDSLRKGGKVDMDAILDMARTCKLGLIIVSDDYFSKTKNPMLELSTFVEHDVPLLPVFYKLLVKDVQNKERKQTWEERWRQWSIDDDRVDLLKWIAALEDLTRTTGVEHLEYRPDVATTYLKYAQEVADHVCCILPPDLFPSDEHVQGKERLCQEVKRMFADAPDVRGAKLLALYGMEGVGKSTLCTALRKFYHAEFAGRVCYVEFERHMNKGNQNGLQLKDILTVCLKLTSVDPRFATTHITDVDQGIAYLDKHLSSTKKFLLILDNIHKFSVAEATKLVLDRKSFPCGSHLLFLGRSRDSLVKLFGSIDNGHIICRFPELNDQEAKRIFLNESLFFLQNENAIQQRQRNYDTNPDLQAIIEQCINLCRVGGSYNPLMLKCLALFLRDKLKDRDKSKKYLSKLEKDCGEAMEDMFKLLEQSFDMLQQQEKDLFLDFALYTLVGKDVKKLQFEQEDAGIDNCLLNLTDMSFWSKDHGVLGVHRDFARKLAVQSEDLLFIQGSTLNPVSVYNRLHPKQKKLALVNCKFRTKDACLDLSGSKHIKVLLLDNVENLKSVNLGTKNLCRMEVNSTYALQVEKIRAISLTLCAQFDEMSWYNPISLLNPSFLVILELGGINNTPWKVDAAQLGECNSLRFVQLDGIELTNGNLDLSCWPCLELLKLSNLAAAMLSGLQNLMALQKFALVACNQLSELQLPGSLRHCSLERCEGLIKIDVVDLGMLPSESLFDEEECILSVLDCKKLEELSGLCELKHVRNFLVGGSSRLHKVKDVLDFSCGASDSDGMPCFISNLELRGSGNVGSLRKLTVEQVSRRGFVQELVEKHLKHARGLERLKVDCAESGLCGCDTYPPDFGLLTLLWCEHKCHLACIDSHSRPIGFPQDQLPKSFSKLDVSWVAKFLELENQESTSNAMEDLCVTEREVAELAIPLL